MLQPPLHPSSLLARTLAFTLALSIAIQPVAVNAARAQGREDGSIEGTIPRSLSLYIDYLNRFKNASSAQDLPHVEGADDFLLGKKQTVERYEARKVDGRWTDVKAEEIDLDDVNAKPFNAKIENPVRELRIGYDHQKKQIRIEQWKYSLGQKRYQLHYAHVIHGIETTVQPGLDPIAMDNEVTIDLDETLESSKSSAKWKPVAPSYLLIAERKGVRSMLWTQIAGNVMRLKLEAPVVIPTSPYVDVTELTILNPSVKPLRIGGERFKAGDIVLKAKPSNDAGGPVREFGIPRDDIDQNVCMTMFQYAQKLFVSASENFENEGLKEEFAGMLDAASEDGKRWLELRESILARPGLDLPVEMLAHMARESDLKGLLGVVHPEKGALKQFSTQPRQPMNQKQWEEDYVNILKRREALGTNHPPEPWRVSLAKQALYPDSQDLKTAEEAERVAKKSRASFLGRSLKVVKKLATKANILKLVAIGAAVGLDIANQSSDFAISRALIDGISYIFNGFQSAELKPEEQIQKAPYIFEQWNALRITGTIVAAIQARIATTWLMGMISKLRKDGFTPAQAFFSYGGRLLSYLSYPYFPAMHRWLVRKFLFEGLLRQKNADILEFYRLNPFTTPGGFQSPFASADKIAQNREKIISYAETWKTLNAINASEEWEKNLRDSIIAAKAEGLDPVLFVMALKDLQEARDVNYKKFLGYLNNPAVAYDYGIVAEYLQEALGSLTERKARSGDTSFDNAVNSASDHYLALKKMARDLKAKAEAYGQKPILDFFEKHSSSYFSDRVVPYLLFSKLNKSVYEKYKNFVLDRDALKLANPAYTVDYDMSLVFWGAVAPADFGGVWNSLNLGLQFGGSQYEQMANYGALGGVDAASFTIIDSAPMNIYPPISVDIGVARGFREQSGKEAFRAYADSAKEGLKNGSGILKIQLQMMKNTLRQFQARLLMGVIPKAIFGGTADVISNVAGSGDPKSAAEIGKGLVETVPRQIVMTGNKLSFTYDSHNGFAPGYVMVAWPMVYDFVNSIKNSAGRNLHRLIDAYAWMGSDNIQEMRTGVGKLLALYVEFGKVQLPQELKVDPAQYTWELRDRLFAFANASPENVATYTKENNTAVVGSNMAGALASSIFYASPFRTFFDQTMPLMPQLLNSSMHFAIIYAVSAAGLHYGPKIVASVTSLPKKIGKLCSDALNRLSNRNKGDDESNGRDYLDFEEVKGN